MGQRKKPKEPEEEFILYLKEHGASEHTVDSCLAALRLFFRLYGEISAENLDAFRRYLMEHYKISKSGYTHLISTFSYRKKAL